MRIVKLYGKDLLLKELQHSLKYFIHESNENGLIRDKTVYSKNVASIAAVGYGLAVLVILVGIFNNKSFPYNLTILILSPFKLY